MKRPAAVTAHSGSKDKVEKNKNGQAGTAAAIPNKFKQKAEQGEHVCKAAAEMPDSSKRKAELRAHDCGASKKSRLYVEACSSRTSPYRGSSSTGAPITREHRCQKSESKEEEAAVSPNGSRQKAKPSKRVCAASKKSRDSGEDLFTSSSSYRPRPSTDGQATQHMEPQSEFKVSVKKMTGDCLGEFQLWAGATVLDLKKAVATAGGPKTFLQQCVFRDRILCDAEVLQNDILSVTMIIQNTKLISAGYHHSCTIERGTLACWGRNHFGQCDIPEGLDGCVKAVVAGGAHTCAVTDEERLVCFGRQVYGECSVSPHVDGNVKSVSAGGCHTCVVTKCGKLYCFGRNNAGQCNVPRNISETITDVAAGYEHTCALTSSGRLLCFGSNGFGECRIPQSLRYVWVTGVAAGDHHTCVISRAGNLVCFGNNVHDQCNVPRSLTGVVAVSACGSHTCALTNRGTLVCFGRNDDGECDVPPNLAGKITAVAAGRAHTVALTADNRVVCFGRNVFGQCNVPQSQSQI